MARKTLPYFIFILFSYFWMFWILFWINFFFFLFLYFCFNDFFSAAKSVRHEVDDIFLMKLIWKCTVLVREWKSTSQIESKQHIHTEKIYRNCFRNSRARSEYAIARRECRDSNAGWNMFRLSCNLNHLDSRWVVVEVPRQPPSFASLSECACSAVASGNFSALNYL